MVVIIAGALTNDSIVVIIAGALTNDSMVVIIAGALTDPVGMMELSLMTQWV